MENTTFTAEEIEILHNGILALIHNASEAINLAPDADCRESLNAYIRKLQVLNTKIVLIYE